MCRGTVHSACCWASALLWLFFVIGLIDTRRMTTDEEEAPKTPADVCPECKRAWDEHRYAREKGGRMSDRARCPAKDEAVFGVKKDAPQS